MSGKRLFPVMAIFFALFLLAACGGDDSDDDANEGENDGDVNSDGDDDENADGDDVENADGDESIDGDEESEEESEPLPPFMFNVISDTHIRLPGNPDDKDYDNQKNIDNLSAAIERINSEFADSDFVAVTGDMVGALFSEDPDDYGAGLPNPADTFKEMMDWLDMPWHAAIGNHDYQSDYSAELGEGVSSDNLEAMEAVWKKVIGIDPYYSFVHNGIRMIFLNSNRGEARTKVCIGCKAEAYCTGSFDNEQLAWFEAELESGDPAILFFHHPPFTDSKNAIFSMANSFLIQSEDPFYDIVETYQDRILAMFTGHGHIWEKDYMYESIPVFETGSTGDTNGNLNNIHIVEVKPEDLSITVTIGRENTHYWSESFSK